MNRQTPIMDAMAAVADTARVRLCMPGHKGDTGYFGGEMLWYDITNCRVRTTSSCPRRIRRAGAR